MAPTAAMPTLTGPPRTGSYEARRQLRAETSKRVAAELRAVALHAAAGASAPSRASPASNDGADLQETAQQARLKIQSLLSRLEASTPLAGVARPPPALPAALPAAAPAPAGRPRRRTAQKIEEVRSARAAKGGKGAEKGRDERLEELRKVKAKKQTRQQTVTRLQAANAFNGAYERARTKAEDAAAAAPPRLPAAPPPRKKAAAPPPAAVRNQAAGALAKARQQLAHASTPQVQATSAERKVFRAAPPSAPGKPAAARKLYRKEELEHMPLMKLRAVAKQAGVPVVPRGTTARTKDETIAAILELASGAAPEASRKVAPPPTTAAAAAAPQAKAAGRQQLMQLVELFPETQQFLKKVETSDRSTPQMDTETQVNTTSAGGRSALMQLVPLFEEAKQFLKKVETVDKSGPLIGADADEGPAFVPAPAQQQLLQLIPLFEETKQFLKKVETADKSGPVLITTSAPTLDPKMQGVAAKLTSALFDLVDEDRSGYLEEGEGKLFLSLQGCDPDELDYYWRDLLRSADVNQDG